MTIISSKEILKSGDNKKLYPLPRNVLKYIDEGFQELTGHQRKVSISILGVPHSGNNVMVKLCTFVAKRFYLMRFYKMSILSSSDGFFKQFSIYTLFNLINSGVGFLLVILLSYYLTPKDFGLYALFTSGVTFALPFLHLGFINAIQVQYFKVSHETLKDYISNALSLSFIAFIVLLSGVWIFEDKLSSWFQFSNNYVYFIPLIAFLKVIPMVVSAIFRSMKKVIHFAIFNTGTSLIGALLSIFFVVTLRLGWIGRVYGTVGAFVVFLIIGMLLLKRLDLLKLNLKPSFRSLKFELMIVPHLFGLTLIDFSDRFFIAHMLDIESAGVYSISYRVAALLTLFYNPFLNAWTPHLYALLNNFSPSDKIKIVKKVYAFIALLAIGLIAVLIAAYVFFEYMVSDSFQEGIHYVLWIALGYIFLSLYQLLTRFMLNAKKTSLLAFLTFFSVILNLGLNYLFIKQYGTIGAAYATTLSFFICYMISAILINRTYKLPWLIFLKGNNDK